MAEYIKREAVIDRLKRNLDACNPGSFSELCYRDAIETVKCFPAADVAPVVRCKDCKHYRNYPNGLCYLHTEPKTNARGYSGEAVCVEPDDFCSYGERKDGADAEG